MVPSAVTQDLFFLRVGVHFPSLVWFDYDILIILLSSVPVEVIKKRPHKRNT
jgi:hypothetical protein